MIEAMLLVLFRIKLDTSRTTEQCLHVRTKYLHSCGGFRNGHDLGRVFKARSQCWTDDHEGEITSSPWASRTTIQGPNKEVGFGIENSDSLEDFFRC